jgi:hypothetical protein
MHSNKSMSSGEKERVNLVQVLNKKENLEEE